MTDWFKARLLGRMRVSTAVLIVAFLALFWVNQNVDPEPPQAPEPAPAIVPPGFVPDPNYTWVPRTNVRRPKEPVYTTTTPPTTSTTTTPTTTTPTTSPTPTTTVVDPDGFGPLPPSTQTVTPTPPGASPATPTTAAPFGPQTTPTTTPAPS